MTEAVDFTYCAVLAILGVFGGVVSTVAGGSIIVAFPLLLGLGFPPVTAVGTYTTAMFPAGLMSAYVDRRHAPQFSRSFFWNSVMALAGGGLGALLLTRTPNQALTKALPVLIILSVVAFYMAPRLYKLSDRSGDGIRGVKFYTISFVIFLYGGYFGAGIGIIMLALYLSSGLDLRRASVQKNILVSFNTVISIIVFVGSGAVAPGAVAILLIGGVFGGYIGGRLITVLPVSAFRSLVLIAGALLAVAYTYRYWFV